MIMFNHWYILMFISIPAEVIYILNISFLLHLCLETLAVSFTTESIWKVGSLGMFFVIMH